MQTIKNSIFPAALLLFVIAFSACEKESQTTITTETNQQLATESSTAVRAKIENFLQNVENPSLLKSGQTMSLDSAVWYTEAALNFVNSTMGVVKDANAYVVDSFYVELPVDNGSVDFQTVTAAYLQMQQQLTNLFNGIENTKKRFAFADVEFENNSLKTLSFIQTKEPNPAAKDIIDDWIWGMDLGKCDGTNQGYDAADLLTDSLRYCGEFYYADPRQEGGWYATNIQDATGQDTRFMFITKEAGNTLSYPEPCLSKEFLQKSFEGTIDFIKDYEDYFSKTCIFLEMQDAGYYLSQEDSTRKLHKMYMKIGNIYSR